jgi:hypothetical protein
VPNHETLLFRFKIDDVPSEKKYKISASLKICYGIGPCALEKLPLIQDFRLPKTLCEWGTGFTSGLKIVCLHNRIEKDLIGLVFANSRIDVEKYDIKLFSEFSFRAWLSDKGLDINAALSPLNTASLLGSLGLSEFLKDPQCTQSAVKYFPRNNGWKNGMDMRNSN